jgi:hypothetical protein
MSPRAVFFCWTCRSPWVNVPEALTWHLADGAGTTLSPPNGVEIR